VDVIYVVAAAHLGFNAKLTTQGAYQIAARQRRVNQREDFIAFFGQLLYKAAAEITFTHTVWAVQQTAGADIAKLLQASGKFLKARMVIRLGTSFAERHLGRAPQGFERDGQRKFFSVHNRWSHRFWR
jgi:hypothetical protein